MSVFFVEMTFSVVFVKKQSHESHENLFPGKHFPCRYYTQLKLATSLLSLLFPVIYCAFTVTSRRNLGTSVSDDVFGVL